MFHVLLSRASVYLCMSKFQKEKNRQKDARSTKAAKKVEVFVQNMFFPQIILRY